MCDVGRTRFFRPWNGEFEDKNSGMNSVEDTTRILETTRINDAEDAIEREIVTTMENDRTMVKSEGRNEGDEDEDDRESVGSSLSGGGTSETGSYRRFRDSRRKRGRGHDAGRRQSVSSSCSTNSHEDSPTTGSLDMLSNFVFGAHINANGRSATKNSLKDAIGRNNNNNSNCSSSSEISSCASMEHSPQSAFTPTSHQCPLYPSFDYLASSLRVGGFANADSVAAAAAAAAAVVSAASYDANYSSQNASHHASLLYGLSSMPIGSYGSSMEEAVKYIHQQDVAAKQMKKLRPKKFRCEHCDVAFSNNGQLKGHIRIHTGERPFKCDADGCGKSFTRNEELTRHKRIHTGLRPHSCILCGKRFGRKDHLKKHTRTHDNRAAYHIPASALGPFAIGHHHSLPPGHPMPSYIYPI